MCTVTRTAPASLQPTLSCCIIWGFCGSAYGTNLNMISVSLVGDDCTWSSLDNCTCLLDCWWLLYWWVIALQQPDALLPINLPGTQFRLVWPESLGRCKKKQTLPQWGIKHMITKLADKQASRWCYSGLINPFSGYDRYIHRRLSVACISWFFLKKLHACDLHYHVCSNVHPFSVSLSFPAVYLSIQHVFFILHLWP